MGNSDCQPFAPRAPATARLPGRGARRLSAPQDGDAPVSPNRAVRAVLVPLQAFLIFFFFLLGTGLSSLAQTSPDFRSLDEILQSATAANAGAQIPGAVLVIGHDGKVVYRKAFGWRSLEPTREPMTVDTVFDVASLTKCLVTATAVMQLVESGRLRLNDPVARLLPGFAANGKQEITVRQLLTHFSGLREDLDISSQWAGKQTAYELANREKPILVSGARFRYSDVNFIVLGELVERLSGMALEQYAAEHIFQPLGMTRTRYLPPSSWASGIAPTEYDHGHMLRGVVHDPTARRMGGVAGHAGVFSTADDLARFAQAMLDGKFVVSSAAIEKLTTPQQPATATVLRGLGWDIESPFSTNRGELLPVGGFGHTGFTGTSMWIDPVTNTYIVLLTNAVHPRARAVSPAVALRARVANAVAGALQLDVPEEKRRELAAITGYNETLTGARLLQSRNGQVKTGLDVLASRGALFSTTPITPASGASLPVAGDGKDKDLPVRPASCASRPCRVGLVTNQTGLDSRGRRGIDLLAHLPDVELRVIFSPEHGISGTVDTTHIDETRDQTTGVRVYSVYGATDAARRPPPQVLKGLDAVVFDIQDAGVRWYTYETTLGYFLEACATAKLPLIVLDRPNPITGAFVQGAVSDSSTPAMAKSAIPGAPASTPPRANAARSEASGGYESFVNYHAIPIRHAMTMGELALLFNSERKLGANLSVVRMQGWQRGDWFDATGLPWTNPSPNLRSLEAATLYPGVALVEGTNVSVGRGTETPFEVLGAPWIDRRQFAAYLNARELSGVRFMPISFTPASGPHAQQLCHGVHLLLTMRNQLDSPELGLEIAAALLKLYPRQFAPERIADLLVNRATFQALLRGDDPRHIADAWRERLEEFSRMRRKYLLY
jgi:uncharacterized protein YbbC (DUF1343 family)/CubicO group peptidase (beta-lactamase class C family)